MGSTISEMAIAAGATAIGTDFYDPSPSRNNPADSPRDWLASSSISTISIYTPIKNFLPSGLPYKWQNDNSLLVKHLLDSFKIPCGLIGTVEYIIGQHRFQASQTTPDECSNQKMLREMCHQGCQAAVMEVSSHALAQNRTSHIDYDIAIFTNLTLDQSGLP